MLETLSLCISEVIQGQEDHFSFHPWYVDLTFREEKHGNYDRTDEDITRLAWNGFWIPLS